MYVSYEANKKIDTEGEQKHNLISGRCCALFMYSMTYLFRSFKLPSCQAGAQCRRERNESHSVSSLLDLVSVNNPLPSEPKKKHAKPSLLVYSFGIRGKCHAKKIL